MLFKFNYSARFPIGEEGNLMVRLQQASGTLTVEQGDKLLQKFSLMDASGRARPLALWVADTADGDVLELGEVTYDRDSLHVEWFEVNDPNVHIAFNGSLREGHLGVLDIRDIAKVGSQVLPPEPDAERETVGHLGVLDIRDIARKHKVVFFFDMMPIILSLEGNRLAVKTLEYREDDPFGPWYFKS